MEESILQQKARITWLRNRDNNTKFFFTTTKARYGKNRIVMLVDGNGNSLTAQHDITTKIIDFYKNLLRS